MFRSVKVLMFCVLVSGLHACDSDQAVPLEPSQTFRTEVEEYQPVFDPASGSTADRVNEPQDDSPADLEGGPITAPVTDSAITPVPNPVQDPTTPPSSSDTVLFLSADWQFTANATNSALNLPELQVLREEVGRTFPSAGLTQGTSNLSCETGNARATAQGSVTVYEFNNCTSNGVTLDGFYQVNSTTEPAGIDTKQKFDDDFDIRLFTASQEIYLAGNSKLSVLERAADECGFVKSESILRQSIQQLVTDTVIVSNMTLEDIMTTDRAATGNSSCSLPTQTLAFSATATVTAKQPRGEMFATQVNRNGVLIDTVGQFVNAGENRNAKLTIYHVPTDALISITAVNLDMARVAIRDGSEVPDFTADFAFK